MAETMDEEEWEEGWSEVVADTMEIGEDEGRVWWGRSERGYRLKSLKKKINEQGGVNEAIDWRDGKINEQGMVN